MKDKDMTIDTAYHKLQKLVEEFEKGELDLEKTLPKFKQGLELAAYLKKKLGELQNEIEEIKTKFEENNPS